MVIQQRLTFLLFVLNFIEYRYYKTDDDVVMDEEIQSLVNELSADGKGSPDSGKGKVTNKLLLSNDIQD